MTIKSINKKDEINKHGRERGNTLILVMLAFPVLLGIAGLTLDWGRGVWVKTQLQKAADAGALAGASCIPDEGLAEYRALSLVEANFSAPDGAVYTALADQFSVELTESVPTLFMGIFGHYTMEVSVSATAGATRPVGGLDGGGFPFAIVNPELNNDPCDDLIPSNYGRPYIIKYGPPNTIVSDWANGCGPPPDPGGNQGWRGALRLNRDGTLGNSGASDLVYNMINGWPGVMHIGDYIPTKPGTMHGPMVQGRNGLLGSDPILWEDFDPLQDGDSSRVVLVAVVHLINTNRQDTYTVQDWLNGAPWDNNTVVIDGFAPFFILTEQEQAVLYPELVNNASWIVGYFIPGVRITNNLPSNGGAPPDFGIYSSPRLIE